MYWFEFPEKEVKKNKMSLTHLSYFEPWDSYRNYLVVKEKYKLYESDVQNPGTFTNFAQNDQALFALHCYIMYLKYGFGRATQDVGIEIRRGAMTRDQGINLVNLYDNHYPEKFIDEYLQYYEMSEEEFNSVLDTWANKKLFKKIQNRWFPKFKII